MITTTTPAAVLRAAQPRRPEGSLLFHIA